MGLFSSAVKDQIDQIAAKSLEQPKKSDSINSRSMNDDLNQMSKKVIEYFKDSPAILISSKDELHDYVDKCIENGYAGIDTETTGLDRTHDWVVGASLYTPGLPECYIPMKHLVPIFETPYKGQLSYEEVAEEFRRFAESKSETSSEPKVKLIFANADFDLAMIYNSMGVDLIPAFYYDVISAWRALKENELDNALKVLYAKYVLKGKADPKKFSDFFSPKLFPYCKPEVAKLYAANDAKITYELFLWQLPFITIGNEKCTKNHLEKISNLIWNIEFPMVKVCAYLHRRGVYLDDSISGTLHERYTTAMKNDEVELARMVQELIDEKDIASNRSRPFATGRDFNPNSGPHVKYLVNKLLGSSATKMDKDALKSLNKPVTNQILKVRGGVKLIGTYVDKMPKAVGKDHRVHGSFRSMGAATGRMCMAEGTQVNSVSRGFVKIESIVPGDEVFCYNTETDEVVTSKVLNLWKTGEGRECVKINYNAEGFSDCLTCTPEHPVFTKNAGWKEAGKLEPGDKLVYIQTKGSIAGFIPNPKAIATLTFNFDHYVECEVASVELDEETHNVYDIEVDNYHNFFASNICVHNSSEAPNMQNIPSHALDIRHMFRATPEMKETIKLEAVDGKVFMHVDTFDRVRSNGELVECSILHEGSKIDSKSSASCLTVVSVSKDHCHLTLDVMCEDAVNIESAQVEVTKPPYIMMSSDYSQQEPKLSAFVSSDERLVEGFKKGRDAYATLASVALGLPYEECLEFNPTTHELNPEGKARRSIGKVLNLGVTYGMSVQSISESLFGDRDDMTDEQKLKEGQRIQDSLMKGFPGLAKAIVQAQQKAAKVGYTETILGRRRHHPNMQLPRFEFEAMPGYVNPDIDPLDPDSLQNKEQIPKRIVDALTKEFNSYKWYGKIVKRTKELAEQKIKVINNSFKIEEASRQVFNCVDKNTEILTTSGWKRFDEISTGTSILSYSIDREKIEVDSVQEIHVYDSPVEVIDFNSPTFTASSTADHRWAVDYRGRSKFVTTAHINKNKWPDYPIIRCGDNSFADNSTISDNMIKLLGWIVTDGSVSGDSITLYQSVNTKKNAFVYHEMIEVLDSLGIKYADRCYDKYPGSHQIYMNVSDTTRELCNIVSHEKRLLSFDLVSTLSQRQCLLLMHSMLQGDGEGVNEHGYFKEKSNVAITCRSQEHVDIFQYIAFRAGFATNAYEITPEMHNSNPSANRVYSSVSNNAPIRVNKSYYKVAVLRVKRAQIYPHHKSSHVAEDGVWCVSTRNQTWIARRFGKVYVTGNSIVQGSAADLTKMAILKLEHDEEWQEIGGRFILPVHDELICEVPLANAEKGAEVLSRCMCEAGDFFPFSLSCDVESSFRWYGLGIEDTLSREKPKDLNWDEMSASNIEWLQCMIVENEFELPVFKEEDGSKPKGVRARGVNGKITDELKAAIESYKNRYNLHEDQEFLDHIEAKVIRGVS